jgi:sugar phosphate isomerase/epimerase
MQIGVSSYSYSRLVRGGTMPQIDIIGAAKAAGFDVIEFSTITVPAGKTLPAFAAELRQEAKQAGIGIANYTIGADFLNGSAGNLKTEIERVKGEVDVAEILGAPSMRHDATGGFAAGYAGPKGFDDALPRLAEGCRAVTEYAAAKGIRTMVENHGMFCQDSVRVEKLMNAVGHPNFGALIDFGNFYCADEDAGQAVGRLAKYAFHAHAKDFHIKSGNLFNPGEGWFMSRGGNFLRGAIIGHGDVPLLQAIRALKRSGYNGVLSIEFEGMEDVLNGLRIGLTNLRRLVELA